MAKINRLRSVKLDEISFVGKGDNPAAHVLLLKMRPKGDGSIAKAGKDNVQEDLLKAWMESNASLLTKEDGEAVTFDEIQNNRELRDKVWSLCYTLEDSISSIAFDDSVTDKTAMISQSIDQFKAAITAITKGEKLMTPEEIAALKKAKEDAEAQVATLTKSVEDVTKENETLKAACAAKDEESEKLKMQMKKEEGEDPIYKGLPETVVAVMKADRDRISKMEDDNLTREYVGKAAEVTLIGKADEIGGLLKTIAKHSTDIADKVFNLFKTADARIKEGDLLKEKGSTKNDGTVVTAYDKIVAKAEAIRKENPALTSAQAFTQVYDTDSELRTAYLSER